MIEALSAHCIAGAGIDVTVEEPLAPTSPLWAMEHVLLTPHTAGETMRYEDNVLAIMQENLQRLWRGEATLRNQIVQETMLRALAAMGCLLATDQAADVPVRATSPVARA